MVYDWHDLFVYGESPYFAMYKAGLRGVPIEEISRWCAQNAIPLREKDVRNWRDGKWRYNCSYHRNKSILNPILKEDIPKFDVLNSRLSDYPKLPDGWTGTDKRWFPCSEDNRPLQKWGYSDNYTPVLYDRESAIALSPSGFVGQNLYAQPFVVIDIDGVGHGCVDERTIEFGRRYSDITETWESNMKPGSFHLYFYTNRIIPIQHWSYAKIDFIGNKTNGAVYTKNKISNGLNRIELTESIWEEIKAYVKYRKALSDATRRARQTISYY